MKKSTILLIASALVLSVSCKNDTKEKETTPEGEVTKTETKKETTHEKKSTSSADAKITVTLEAKSDSGVTGNAVFKQENGIVSLMAVLSGLSEGTHAVHLHEKSDCSSPDGKSTGGHWNPTAQPHGKWGSDKGYHKGDIGNFTANEKGQGTITFATDEWCIGCGDPAKDIVGKAIIIHQGTDDFTSQPTGAAGGRVSCGGIIE
jgi:Cu-Zn family superoxide dismutase